MVIPLSCIYDLSFSSLYFIYLSLKLPAILHFILTQQCGGFK
ncbi:hypothetical protein CLOSYM_00309 [[Clostridium] symbiosum ATCC 14940]|uniref:Uncharacterized protein n=1 Tax=[Clostridium] symbiosum ATCC 14940 TaxID=411472 RepID=A0ABC9U3M0_CLOSY|nr:hypothetical protein CLOSYM_00309 [[Clostridium] symbiosum ATCC 14940]